MAMSYLCIDTFLGGKKATRKIALDKEPPTREEYIAALKQAEPGAAITAIYYETKGRNY